MTEIHRAVRRHLHDDKLLDLLGGVQRVVGRLDALLARHAPAGEPTQAETATPRAAIDDRGEVVDVMLGVIAIRDRFAAAVSAACTPPRRESPAASPPEGPLLR